MTKGEAKAKSGGPKAEPTPVMRQFFAAKAAHPGSLLFFRMGDFYELFYDDAVVAARALDLTLTSRNKGATDEVPMAGVPHHAASQYIQRLLEQGFSVAICEQMADPATVKGIVPREVVRVVTPGLVYDDAGLDARENHFLAAVECEDGRFGLAAFDGSTGELLASEVSELPLALAELMRFDPHEVLLGPGAEAMQAALLAIRPRTRVRQELSVIGTVAADALLDEVLGEGEAARSASSPLARRAAARCIALAKACEPRLWKSEQGLPVRRLVSYTLGDTLLLDEATQRHLELVRTMDGDAKGALLSHVDETKTAVGARLLRRRLLAPSTKLAEIRRRHDAVELFVTQPGLRTEVRRRLGEVSDLERLSVKLLAGRAGPRDLLAVRRSLEEVPAIVEALAACPDASAHEVAGVPLGASGPSSIDLCDDLRAELAHALAEDPPVRASDGGVLREGFDVALDEARLLARDGQRMIVELEGRLRESAQISSLKVRFTRVFGWYLEVTRAHVERAPKAWRRKQTIATGERFTCDELDTLADAMAHAEDRTSAREAELFTTLLASVASRADRLRTLAAQVAEWDVASAFAEVAHRADYVRPEVDESLSLSLEDARHPVVERLAAAGRFVPNDVVLDADPKATADTAAARLWLVTGPNMAGKSTLMRQVALIVVLAQAGAFVPARHARVGLVDRILTRVGASDNLSRGESTFMMEMKETANVLRRATRRSLVVLDEIGRGTSTYDGLAIAWAVAEHLHDVIGCRALFATHYHELTELARTRRGCENWSVTAREHEGEIVFLHRLQRGAASRSYGVACARIAGLPEAVLARAKVLLAELEQSPGPATPVALPRGRAAKAVPQLDLFGQHAAPPEHPTLGLLRTIDPDRLTPLEALQLVVSLKASLEAP